MASDNALPVNAQLVDLNQAIEMGLARNADVVTLRASEDVGEAVVGVARTYPFNPIVQTRILPYGRHERRGSTSTYNYVLLWQTFELAHQKRFRESNAVASLDAIRWDIQQANLQNISLTLQLYFTALYQHGLLDLAQKTSQLNDQLQKVMTARLKQGQTSAADVAVIRLDTRSAKHQVELARSNYQNALLALQRHLNPARQSGLVLDGDLREFNWHRIDGVELARLSCKGSAFEAASDQVTLVGELAASRPDVLGAHSRVEAARANLGLARAARVPNVMIGPFYIRDAAATMNLGFQAQMEIPVVNTGRPLQRQREAEFRQQLTTLEQLESKARVEAQTALERYERARELWSQVLADDAGSPSELLKLEAQFRKGEVDFLRVSQARNSLIQFHRTHLDTLNELAQAAAGIPVAAGIPPAAIVSRK